MKRTVHRNLLIVDAKTMAMSVWVGEKARLQYRVSGRLYARDHVRGRECGLLYLAEVVIRVSIKGEFAKAA
jgi:hypothetical protein